MFDNFKTLIKKFNKNKKKINNKIKTSLYNNF